MADPFVTALGVLLQAPGSVAGVFVRQAGGSTPLRAIRNAQEAELSLGSIGRAVAEGSSFTVALADLPDRPRRGDVLLVDGAELSVLADGRLDAEGTGWLFPAA